MCISRPVAHLVLIAALAAATAMPAWADQKLVPGRSEISFVSKQLGVPVEGRFRTFDAQVAFDPKKPAAANIAFTIDLASVSIGAPETEAELAKADWFDTAKFPKATFQSTSVKATGPASFDVAGKLVIKSLSHDVVVPVKLVQAGAGPTPETTATGMFTIKRLDWRIGDGDWKDTSTVADPVQVKFRLVLSGVPPV